MHAELNAAGAGDQQYAAFYGAVWLLIPPVHAKPAFLATAP